MRSHGTTYHFIIVGVICGTFCGVCGCVPTKKANPDSATVPVGSILTPQKPLSPEKTEALVSQVGENWVFGQGVGETALNVGTAVVFPPYIVYLLGNAALGLSGHEELRPSELLPDEPKEAWQSIYGAVTESPGRVAAAAAGREFRTKEVIKTDFKELLESPDTKSESGKHR